MELRIPDDVGQQQDRGLREIHPDFPADSLRVFRRFLVKIYPVAGSAPAALQVFLGLLPMAAPEGKFLPVFGRLNEKRMMVRVTMAENETLLAIGRGPVDEPHVEFARCLAGYSMGDIDSMVKTRAMDPLRGEDPGHDVCREQACLKIPAQHGFRVRFSLERAPCEESQSSGQRVLANLQSILDIPGDLIHRGFAVDPGGFLAARVVEKRRISQDLQAQEIVELLPVPKAWRAAGGGWPIGGKLLDGLKNDEHALLAGRKRGVAEEQAYPRASQRQSHREQTLDLRDGRVPSRARCQKNVRSA